MYMYSVTLYLKVGGEFFEVVLSNMNKFGRVSICGAISLYNVTDEPKCKWNHRAVYRIIIIVGYFRGVYISRIYEMKISAKIASAESLRYVHVRECGFSLFS